VRQITKPSGSLADEVYRIPFGGGAGRLPTKETVGSKAHNLMRLAQRGLPVPPAFVLSTEVCRDYLRRGAAALEGLEGILDRELRELGARTGRYFGDAKRPLLLSVRSGAAISMPGMMETVLNVGLIDVTLRALIRMTGNPRLAYDCQRRLLQQYGEVVHSIVPARFESKLKAVLVDLGASDVDELDTGGLRQIGDAFLEEFEAAAGERFPSDPKAQLRAAIEAVFRSWASARAQSYRKLNGIPDDLGTAAIVQAMVFGNLGPTSGSGVGFTRSPADGSNELYVDYLANAQGEDVVAGRRRTMGLVELERRAPEAYRALIEARPLLEQ
jgi:pyruvate,orthophosphate dikinase